MLKFIHFLNEGKEFKQLKGLIDPIVNQVFTKIKEMIISNSVENKEIIFSSLNEPYSIKINIPINSPHVKITFSPAYDLPAKSKGVYNPYKGGVELISNDKTKINEPQSYRAVGIIYIPLEFKNLNEIKRALLELISHEIIHIFDKIYHLSGEDWDNKNKTTPRHNNFNNLLDYYLRPTEILAHLKGFIQRLNYSKNKSLEDHIRQYFERHQDIGKLTKQEKELIVDTYLKKARELGLSLSRYKSDKQDIDLQYETKIFFDKLWNYNTNDFDVEILLKRLKNNINIKDKKGKTFLFYVFNYKDPNGEGYHVFRINKLINIGADGEISNNQIEKIMDLRNHSEKMIEFIKRKIKENNSEQHFKKFLMKLIDKKKKESDQTEKQWYKDAMNKDIITLYQTGQKLGLIDS